jgi:hypothetical protein
MFGGYSANGSPASAQFPAEKAPSGRLRAHVGPTHRADGRRQATASSLPRRSRRPGPLRRAVFPPARRTTSPSPQSGSHQLDTIANRERGCSDMNGLPDQWPCNRCRSYGRLDTSSWSFSGRGRSCPGHRRTCRSPAPSCDRGAGQDCHVAAWKRYRLDHIRTSRNLLPAIAHGGVTRSSFMA